MTPTLNTQLMTQLRRRSAIVSSCVLVCLVSQAMLPGVANLLTSYLSSGAVESSGCCVVNLADAASTCCCGTKAGGGCGCACGKKSSSETATTGKKTGRSFRSEVCGCGSGSEHRAGIVSSIEPAVLHSADLPLMVETEPRLPEFITSWDSPRLAPPVPPPELTA